MSGVSGSSLIHKPDNPTHRIALRLAHAALVVCIVGACNRSRIAVAHDCTMCTGSRHQACAACVCKAHAVSAVCGAGVTTRRLCVGLSACGWGAIQRPPSTAAAALVIYGQAHLQRARCLARPQRIAPAFSGSQAEARAGWRLKRPASVMRRAATNHKNVDKGAD